ncbi:MAG: ribosome maturation factor RimP [Desulfonatronovibrionaceae bacterium]
MQDDRQKKIQELIQPLCTAMGVDLWGVETSFSGRRGLVRIYIDTPQGVTLEQCTELSREAGNLLDVEDLIHGSYNLEVSSPGLDRVFFTPKQLAQYLQREIRVILHEPVDGRKKFTGPLLSVSGDRVCMRIEESGEEFCFDFSQAGKIKLLFRG